MPELANWLRTQLKQRGLTQAQLAVHAGIAQATLSEILCKGHIPRVAALYHLADYLGVDHTEILRLAGHLPAGDPAPPDDADRTIGPLERQLLAEFRLLPPDWKPEVIEQVRMFQHLVKRPPPLRGADSRVASG